MTTYPPLLRYTDSDGRKWKEVRGRPSKRKVRSDFVWVMIGRSYVVAELMG